MRLILFVAVGMVSLNAGRAWACAVDTDCTSDPQCGGSVCTFPGGMCVAAGTNPGWCHTDAECKCRAYGAKCTAGLVCSFTQLDPAADFAGLPFDLSVPPQPDMA